MLVKYKVSEVAKDFGLKSKDIIDLLAKYFEKLVRRVFSVFICFLYIANVFSFFMNSF